MNKELNGLKVESYSGLKPAHQTRFAGLPPGTRVIFWVTTRRSMFEMSGVVETEWFHGDYVVKLDDARPGTFQAKVLVHPDEIYRVSELPSETVARESDIHSDALVQALVKATKEP